MTGVQSCALQILLFSGPVADVVKHTKWGKAVVIGVKLYKKFQKLDTVGIILVSASAQIALVKSETLPPPTDKQH